MKKLVFMVMMFFFGITANAQAWTGKGDQKVQLGLSAWGYGTGITGTYDYGLNKLISVGAGLNGYFSNYKNNDKDNRVFVFGRLNFHLQEALNLPPKLDIYPGVDVGVVGKDFGIGAHIGARYFFTERIGVFAEVGNNGSLGVSFNL
ncbi:hypothetical protein EG344_12310 [Chryseobacterium sp. G0162]|uniref:Outer membrane protein beta-barrel domain-containing protein n=2 Tax=Chryseobacterium TaxID=59732 RepID=A0A2X2VSQ1_CHRJE|nr:MULTISPECIES: DUF6646 family protein [Chryseobacterium]AZA91525.1 hypothetical protein EG343_13210 [Chryseobacterium nakagawai]AZB09536.1 hypothetical protein EG344_12310 [Chryseobacterium sp. G0162]SDJ70579.1 hypothetical protein SAMN05421542_4155 [Chryseobacterium jejuense]SQB26515.1 Uncharacterised protein [Chryseobacterium jejuense]VEH23126.1 Uncharacterised protein [Chryseobacterium nakagawai]